MILACEVCRRRKVRCSGTAPCTTCQRHMQECYFEYNRKRRGPRPKKSLMAPKQTACPEPGHAASEAALEAVTSMATTASPTPPSSEPSQGETDVGSKSPRNKQQRRDEGQAAREDIQVQTPILFNGNHLGRWRAQIAGLLSGTTPFINNQKQATVDFILHLVITFHATADNLYRPHHPTAAFFHDLESGKAPAHLCFSMGLAALAFTRHPLANTAEKSRGLADRLEREARHDLFRLKNDVSLHGVVHKIQTLAMLSTYDIQMGRGNTASNDIQTAMNLVSMTRQRQDTQRDAEVGARLATVQDHLIISICFVTLGHPAQMANAAMMLDLVHHQMVEEMSSSEGSRDPTLPACLSRLFLHCSSITGRDMTQLVTAPWCDDSEYMRLKCDVDAFYIAHAGDLTFESKVFAALHKTSMGAGEYVWRLSMLYAMRILLNRPFLPIRTTSAPHTGVRPSTAALAPPAPSSRSLLHFPGAPAVFSRERAAACIRGAQNLTAMCRCVLETGAFVLSPILGYSLFLSGLVFLNQLHVEEDQSVLEGHVDDLKTVFTVLGAMRSFYHTANLWVDVLFHVHAMDLISRQTVSGSGSAKLFRGFFCRFQGVDEPPFCTLDPVEATMSATEAGTSSETVLHPRGVDDQSQPGLVDSVAADTVETHSCPLDEYRRVIGEASREMAESDPGTAHSSLGADIGSLETASQYSEEQRLSAPAKDTPIMDEGASLDFLLSTSSQVFAPVDLYIPPNLMLLSDIELPQELSMGQFHFEL